MTRIVGTLGIVGLSVSSCDTAHTVAPPKDVAPAASTPVGAVQRLARAFDHSDLDAVRELLSENATMHGAVGGFRWNLVSDLMLREDLIIALASMFNGVQGVSAPARATLTLDRNLIPFADTRADHSGGAFRTIRSSYQLTADETVGKGTIQELLRFYRARVKP